MINVTTLTIANKSEAFKNKLERLEKAMVADVKRKNSKNTFHNFYDYSFGEDVYISIMAKKLFTLDEFNFIKNDHFKQIETTFTENNLPIKFTVHSMSSKSEKLEYKHTRVFLVPRSYDIVIENNQILLFHQ